MSQKYPHLLSPIQVGKHIFKNRMLSSNSLPHFLQGPESYPARSVIMHYANRAKSGAAMVTCMGICNMTRGYNIPTEVDAAHFPDFDLYDPASQNYLMQLADALHYYDCIACMSLYVGRKSDYYLMRDGKGVGVPAHKAVEEYNEATLNDIVGSYVQQVKMLKWLGYDMVSLHFAYRNQLPARFLSPLTNHRTDEYGGSLENRARFALQVLRSVREAVGPDFLVEILLSAEEPEGGYNIDDAVKFLKMAEDYIDIVQVRAPEADPNHPTGFCLEETPYLKYAEYIKKSGVNVLVTTVGGYQYMESCEKAIAEGKTDFISMARSWISNPNYGQLVYEGRDEDMVPCIRCNKCHGRGKDDPFVSVCSVNPIMGIEHMVDDLVVPPGPSKKVAVVGGGPAGMKAAMELCDRGHQVTLYEASGSLGGAIRHADCVDFKWPLRNFKNYLIRQVEKRAIEVKLNTPVTPEALKNQGYEAIVLALGAEAIRPHIPGADGAQVILAEQALFHQEEAGQHVVVIGGGEVGVETGMHLAEHGHDVTVLEMRDTLAANTTLIHYRSMFQAAWESLDQFHAVLNARCTSIEPGRVYYVDENGTEQVLEADTVVLSVGMKAKKEEALAFFDGDVRCYMIGDCRKPATIQQAMRSAFATASTI